MNTKSNQKQSALFAAKDALKQLNSFIESNFKAAQKIILTDDNTLQFCLPILQKKCRSLKKALVITINSGEQYKNEKTAYFIWQQLAENFTDRNALIINLGGGVVTDIGGFCASTYKRGIEFINIPTTLMAMVDAAYGGKTGINLNELKNFVGTFSLPKAVAIDSQFLKTLDERNILSGFAEMIKHALIADAKLFKYFESNPLQKNITAVTIQHSVKIKAAVVKKDPEEKNLRKLLNFGHTVGHAVESYSLANDKNPLLHGECVAIGMLIESFLSYKCCKLKRTKIKAIAEYIDEVYVLPKFSQEAIKKIIKLMYHDKKNSNGILNFTLLKKIGQGLINQQVPADVIENAFLFYNEMAE
jgi:3-dehydroquinate synthase